MFVFDYKKREELVEFQDQFIERHKADYSP